MLYRAVHCSVKQSNLLKADVEIRRLTKRWLHLSPGTTNGLLYSRNNDGGLAVPRLSKIAPLCMAKRIFSLYHSQDVTAARIAKRILKPCKFLNRWKTRGGDAEQGPLVLGDLMDQECRRMVKLDCWRGAEFELWSKMGPQGFETSLFRKDAASNSWLARRGRHYWKEAHFIRALQMRVNVLPTLEFRHRGASILFTPPCRACGVLPETMSHILGQCAETKLNRMTRKTNLLPSGSGCAEERLESRPRETSHLQRRKMGCGRPHLYQKRHPDGGSCHGMFRWQRDMAQGMRKRSRHTSTHRS